MTPSAKRAPAGLWAKLHQDENGDTTDWHPLAAHSADVAAVCEQLLHHTILRRRLATLANWDTFSDRHIARLCVFAAIHDAGKVNHGFQDAPFTSVKSPGHVRPLVDVLGSDDPLLLLEPLGIRDLALWFEEEDCLIDFLLASWGHHGEPVLPQFGFNLDLWRCNGRRDPLNELSRLSVSVRKWFPDAFKEAKPFPSSTFLQHAFNGLLTVADWIGSDEDLFPFAPSIDIVTDGNATIDRARRKAKEACRKLHLIPDLSRRALGTKPPDFTTVLPDPSWTPFDIQQACLDSAVYENGGLAILESDTGSGKTESALARFLRLFFEGRVDGLYFAVPTRSAAKQLQERVQTILRRAFTDKAVRPPVIQAVPGYIKADDKKGTRLPGYRVRWDDVQDKERGWAAEHAKRYLIGSVVVGTIDQVLLSGLQVRHAHMRSAALLRHLLVIDEVHASDVYMTSLTENVLNHHLQAGGYALLMSATLGASARHRFTAGDSASLPPPEVTEKEPYPLLTTSDGNRDQLHSRHAPSSGKEKTVRMARRSIAGNPFEIAIEALSNAKRGGRVLVIRNTVRECREVQRALDDLAKDHKDLLFKVNGVATPHHSRYAPVDRHRLDEAIERYLGKDTQSRGFVAVCTQTVEQSLDIDADLLITDLCPVDVLLQRIGRLHRHDRTRPQGFANPLCIVLIPEQRDLTRAILEDGRGLKGPHGLGTVYQDLRVIEATLRLLEEQELKTWTIPKHNRLLVERATHPDYLKDIVSELGEQWRLHEQALMGQNIADIWQSETVALDRSVQFSQTAFPSDGEKLRTRLGDQSYRVELPEPETGPFGSPVSVLTISEHLIKGEVPESVTADDVCATAEGFTFTFANTKFSYGRLGLVSA